MKTIIVSHEIYGLNQNLGGTGTFVRQFSELLHANNHEVSLLCLVEKYQELPVEALHYYQSLKIEIIQIIVPEETLHMSPMSRERLRSEAVAAAVRDADIVYFNDGEASEFHIVKEKRFNAKKYPICVNVLHSCRQWTKAHLQQHLFIPNDLFITYMEQYSVQHSAIPSPKMRY
jgi:hypothetical protein